MFDHDLFRAEAHQLRDHADGYAALDLTACQAAQWANHGFLPGEAVDWLGEGFTDALEACGWANRYVAPAVARKRTAAGEKAHPNGFHEGLRVA
jgi:hypothetical protein